MFKKGEKIICIEARGVQITVGKIYEVLSANEDYVSIVKDNGQKGTYYSKRFEPAKKPGVFKVGDRVVIDEVALEYAYNGPRQFDRIIPAIGNPDLSFHTVGSFASIRNFVGHEGVITEINAQCTGCKIEGKTDYWWSFGWIRHVAHFEEQEKYEVGQYIFVERAGDPALAPKWVPEMEKFIGKKVKITEIKNGHVKARGFFFQAGTYCKYDPKKHDKPKADNLREFIAKYRKLQARGLCAFTKLVMNDKGEITPDVRNSAPCHAALSYGNYGKVVCVIDHIKYHLDSFNTKKDKSEYRAYVRYIMDKSPWSIAYVNGGKAALENDAIINVDRHADVVAAACIALRMGSEFKWITKAFAHFRKKMSEDAAFLLAFTFGQAKGNQYQIQAMGGGHQVLAADILTTGLLTLFKEGYSKDRAEPEEQNKYKNQQIYSVHNPISRLNTKDEEILKVCNGKLWRTFVQDMCQKKEIGKGWDKAVFYTEESIIEFGQLIDNLIGKE